tara:strand:+ start:346 stop:618 length:273 start_codon:yes stop_codon:yes gene_type:complete
MHLNKRVGNIGVNMQLTELEKEANSLDAYLSKASEKQSQEIRKHQEAAQLIINIARQTNSQRHREFLAPRQAQYIKDYKEQLEANMGLIR